LTATDLNQIQARRAVARLTSNPRIARRYSGELRELLDLAQVRSETDQLTDLQVERLELVVESLRAELTLRKKQAELQVRRLDLQERELDEVLDAAKKRTKARPSQSRASQRGADG
jgi:hypothetical protein